MEIGNILKTKGIGRSGAGTLSEKGLQSVESGASRDQGRNADKKEISALKTLYASPEIRQILQKSKNKSTEQFLNSKIHSNSLIDLSESLPHPAKIPGVMLRKNTGQEYVKQKRYLRMPIVSLRAQIESIGRNLQERIEKEKKKKEEYPPVTCHTVTSVSEVEARAFKSVAQPRGKAGYNKNNMKQLFNGKARSMQTSLLQKASEYKNLCFACKFKERTITELESTLNIKNEEIKRLSGKLNIFHKAKSIEPNPTLEIATYQHTIENLEKCVQEKDAKIKHIESLMKTFQFYNGFSKQQSYFVEYAREMEKLEQENSRLRFQVNRFQRDSFLPSPSSVQNSQKKESICKITKMKENNNKDSLNTKLDENRMPSVSSFMEVISNLSEDFVKLKELFSSKDFINNLVSAEVQKITPSLFEKFEVKEEDSDSEESDSFSSLSHHSGESVDEQYRKKRIPRAFKKTLKLLCEGIKVFSNQITKLQAK